MRHISECSITHHLWCKSLPTHTQLRTETEAHSLHWHTSTGPWHRLLSPHPPPLLHTAELSPTPPPPPLHPPPHQTHSPEIEVHSFHWHTSTWPCHRLLSFLLSSTPPPPPPPLYTLQSYCWPPHTPPLPPPNTPLLSTEQAAKTQPNKISLFHLSSFLTTYLLFMCRFVALDRGDSPPNVHAVCSVHIKRFLWTFSCLDLDTPLRLSALIALMRQYLAL